MIRVAHFFGKMDRGGAETFIMNIYRIIDRERVQFNFIVTNSEAGCYDDEIRKLGGRIFILPKPSNHLKNYMKQLKELFKKEKFDIAHSHVHYFSGINLKIARNCGVKKTICHSHNTSDGRKNTLLRAVYRKYMLKLIEQNSDYFLSCGVDAAKSLYGDNSNKAIEVINNGIDLDKFSLKQDNKKYYREKLGLDKDAYIIGHIGRFEEQKNHKGLIEIFKYIHSLNKKAFLVLVGDGVLRPEIEKSIIKLGLSDRVKFMGIRSDIPQIINTFDLFLFPSLYEGLPVVLIEVQACGVPCAISDTISKEVDMGMEIVHYFNINRFKEDSYFSKLGYYNKVLSSENIKEIMQNKGYCNKIVAEKLQNIYCKEC